MTNDPLYRFIEHMATDQRLSCGHLCLYNAIAYMGKNEPPGNLFRISRKELLRYTGFRSIVTYHKRLKELVSYGYILYRPSYDPFHASQAALI